MYKECITCAKIGTECDGGNLIALPAQELIEWCKLRKAHLKISNARIAELSNIPKGTVDRILASDGTADFRYESIRLIVKALLGGTFEGIPCPDPNPDERAAETIERIEADCERIRGLYLDAIKHHREDIQAERSAEEFLMMQIKQKQKTIVILGVLLALSLGTILAALIIDRLNSNIGFFWLKDLLAKGAAQNIL